MKVWLLMLVCGLITFLTRFVFIGAEGRLSMPAWFRRLLPFVPIAALTALVMPDILLVGGELALGFNNPKCWAGLFAIAVAARWRNTLLTISAGFVAFAVLRAMGTMGAMGAVGAV